MDGDGIFQIRIFKYLLPNYCLMSKLITYISHLSFSVLFTYIIIFKSLPFLKKIFPAKPTQRGMHKIIKPSSGGISFIFTYLILVVYQGFYLPLFSLPLGIVGMIDDKYNISKFLRFVFQILTILSIIFYIGRDESAFIGNLLSDNLLYLIPLIFFGAVVINSINFMDGIDGLVCGCMIIIFIALNVKIHYLIPIIGTLLAFLKFNWFPSKVFMGDSGSLFLGSFLVSLIFLSENIIEVLKVMLLCSPLFLDALICIFRRLINKQNIFKSHKLHLYQRLVTAGLRHSTVSLIYISSTFLLSIVFIFSNFTLLSITAIMIFIIGIYLDKNYAQDFHFRN